MHSDWLKQQAFLENRTWVNDVELAFKVLAQDFEKI